MLKRGVYLSLLIFLSVSVFAQQKTKIALKQAKRSNKNIELISEKSNGFILKETISVFELVDKQTKEGNYSQLISEGLSKTFDAGKPDLPVINRLIEIPVNAEVKVKILNYEEEVIDLKDYGFEKLIIPAQASHEKSKDLKDVPFTKDNKIYNRNEFFKKDIIKFEDRGYLRNKHLGYVEISPFAYNPVTNTLKVISNIEIEVSFEQTGRTKITNIDRLTSPYFENTVYNTINKAEESKALISGPVKYVIVSDRMFEATLRSFVEWKTMKGFNVIEAYTDVIGTTTTEIKNYLEDLYNNPDDGISPTFVLLVGDVTQIPAFSASGHVTDLYYCEYTGDKLPEVFYGRFSAETIEELQPQIDKTLEVEKYEMPDPSYLDNVVLVAGVDGPHAPTYGNGAINYVNDYYTNLDNGINSYYYLYGDDSGVMSSSSSGASASIRSNISAGVSFSNYTAHCSSNGWADPSFSISNIADLTNEHMYPLIIGNCCESSAFNADDCFGEEILMAANKGAVGYIGGSNSTYWDEDYYWGVGLTSSISVNPTYEGSGLGAYDRFFHLNEEAKEDWYVTQGQINVAGNLAVEASSSTLKSYYWEIYHLMGDPSLTPFVTVPEVLVSSYDSEIITGVSSFQVITEENAYVALSKEGVLLDAQLVDESGSVELQFESLTEVVDLDLVITKQNRQPVIEKITVVPASSPYITLDYHVINDALGNNNSELDFGETISLDVQFKNISDTYDAFNVVANLNSADTNIVITDNTENLGTILKSDSATISGAYTIQLNDKFSDQHNLKLELVIVGKDSENEEYTWNSNINLTVNAPELEIKNLLIDDSAENDNGVLDPGETADISLVVSNIGNAAISELNAIATILGDGATYLTLNNTETGSFSIEALEIDTIKFSATANSGTPIGTLIYLSFNIDDVAYNYYSVTDNKEVNIGDIPEILISDEDTTIADKAYFYDTGGSVGNYSDSENDTITLKPVNVDKYLNANFLSFGVESETNCNYDYLKIFDGSSTEASLIGKYCGSSLPESVSATNEEGALTFVFHSDVYTTSFGWEAEVKSFVGYDYQVTVSGPDGAVEGAIVEFLGRTKTTDMDGVVEFTNVPEGVDYAIKISATGYEDYETSVSLFDNTSEEFILSYSKFNVTFNLFDENGEVDGDITFNGETLFTENGSATFTDVIYSLDEEYLVQAFGHEDSTASIEVTDDMTKDIVLNILKYNITFVVSDGIDPVEDAVVEFDNKEINTNIDGVALFEQVNMDTALTYIIRKTGYDNAEDKIHVVKNSTVNILMDAGTATFKVEFKVYGESAPLYNAQVVLDEDTLYTDANGIAIFENILEANDIAYKVSKIHFRNVTGTINVADDNIKQEINLSYTSYEIVFDINDGEKPIEGASVSFDGKSGATDTNGQCLFDVVYSLNKEYAISKFGFDTADGKVNVDAYKTVELSLTLLTYNVTFIVNDPYAHVVENVTVNFNNESKNTDVEGKAIFEEVACGYDLDFTLTKTGFWNYDSTLNVVDGNVEFNARLSSTTGINPINVDDIQVYPNPSNGLFNVEISGSKNNIYEIKVFDVIGSIVYSDKVNGNSFIKEQIDISHKAKGLYFLSVESEDGSVISKRILVK